VNEEIEEIQTALMKQPERRFQTGGDSKSRSRPRCPSSAPS
jgi:hypothetical protein